MSLWPNDPFTHSSMIWAMNCASTTSDTHRAETPTADLPHPQNAKDTEIQYENRARRPNLPPHRGVAKATSVDAFVRRIWFHTGFRCTWVQRSKYAALTSGKVSIADYYSLVGTFSSVTHHWLRNGHGTAWNRLGQSLPFQIWGLVTRISTCQTDETLIT